MAQNLRVAFATVHRGHARLRCAAFKRTDLALFYFDKRRCNVQGSHKMIRMGYEPPAMDTEKRRASHLTVTSYFFARPEVTGE